MNGMLLVPDFEAVPFRSFRHHVHTEVTRDRRQEDPRTPGRSRHEPFSITRSLDGLTPHLLRWCAEGRVLPELTLSVVRPPLEDVPEQLWFTFTLSRVLVTSVLTSVEDDGPLETITLDYGAIHWAFVGGEPNQRAGWDVLANTPLD